jgi:hypothetical protein
MGAIHASMHPCTGLRRVSHLCPPAVRVALRGTDEAAVDLAPLVITRVVVVVLRVIVEERAICDTSFGQSRRQFVVSNQESLVVSAMSVHA